jgi:hypothetical protein
MMVKETRFFRKQADKAERMARSAPISKSRNVTGTWRALIAGEAVPEHIQDFVDTYAGPTRQLTLRL